VDVIDFDLLFRLFLAVVGAVFTGLLGRGVADVWR
jgi:hypothetical protein